MKRIVDSGFALALVAPSASSVDAQGNSLSFFITSTNPGKGADLGGLAGADAHCAALAKAAGAGNRVWRAYLSTTGADGKPGVNAKDRIGTGPWFNAKGVQVAASVADLHSDTNKLSKENSLNEKGEVNNGRGDTPNRHDILTGTNLDGTAATATCNNWTSSARRRRRAGRPSRSPGRRPESDVVELGARHPRAAAIDELRKVGGEGFFYCFAAK